MMLRLIHLLLLTICLSPVRAQVVIERFFSVQSEIPDYGQYVDARTISETGLASILDVDVGLLMSSAFDDTMRLGDYFVSLTYGTASEEERVAVLLNRPRASDVRQWGSSLSSADFFFDDSQNAPNVFYTSTSTGVFAADGRLSVNPYATAQAYDASTVTHGLSQLNGEILSSDRWSLLVADTRQGATGYLESWSLRITGDTLLGGSLNPGAGGVIYDKPDTASEVLANLVVAGSGSNRVTANVATNLVLSGGLSGSGELIKKGSGKLTLGGDSNAFSGQITIQSGEIEIMSNTALGQASQVLLEGAASKVTLSNGAAISTNVFLANQAVAAFDGSGVISGPIAGAGKFIKEGNGRIELTGNNTYVGQTVIRSGVLQLGNGGAGGSISTSSPIINDSALVINQSDIVRQGIDFTSEAITGIGSFTASGSGTTVLIANNTYEGETYINRGADLRINGNHAGMGDVNVAADSHLGGSGSVKGDVYVDGTLSPGNSIESFGTSTVNFSIGSMYAYEINSAILAADLLYSDGNVNIEWGTILGLSDLSSTSTPITGTKFTLISSFGPWNGGLFQYDSGAGLVPLLDDSLFTFGANTWLMNYNDTSPGVNFIDDTSGASNFITMTAVPESGIALFLGSFGVFSLMCRRRA